MEEICEPTLADAAAGAFHVGFGAGAEHSHPGGCGAQGQLRLVTVVALGRGVGAEHLTLLGTGALAGVLMALHHWPDLGRGQGETVVVGHR